MHKHINNKEVKVCFSSVFVLKIKQLEDEIQSFCFRNDFYFKIQRGKTFFFKPIFVTIKCPPAMIDFVVRKMENMGAWTYIEK